MPTASTSPITPESVAEGILDTIAVEASERGRDTYWPAHFVGPDVDIELATQAMLLLVARGLLDPPFVRVSCENGHVTYSGTGSAPPARAAEYCARCDEDHGDGDPGYIKLTVTFRLNGRWAQRLAGLSRKAGRRPGDTLTGGVAPATYPYGAGMTSIRAGR